ncbi:HS12B-like protein, partial [Mya arenaria]
MKLALEPECASIWCNTLGKDVKGALAIQGAQYMVVDLGGGTADISVHYRKPDGTLKEIHKAGGCPWGSIFVDENYMEMLPRLYGKKAVIDLQNKEMSDYFDITREFEIWRETDRPSRRGPRSVERINLYGEFDEEKFPNEKKVWKNGKWLVEKYFDVYVLVNEE